MLQLLKWVHRGDEAVQLYKNFVIDLCSAHNYYTQFALQQLLCVFSEGKVTILKFFSIFLKQTKYYVVSSYREFISSDLLPFGARRKMFHARP